MKQHKFLLIFMVTLAPTLLAANVDTTEMSFSFEPASMNLQVFKKDVIAVPAAMRIQVTAETRHFLDQVYLIFRQIQSHQVEDLPTLIHLVKDASQCASPIPDFQVSEEIRPVF